MRVTGHGQLNAASGCTFVIKSKEDESAEKYLLLVQIRAVLSSLFFFDISTALASHTYYNLCNQRSLQNFINLNA